MTEDLLQSNDWEQFQRALGRRTHRVGGVLAIEMSLPFGFRYWYSPRGSLPIRHCEDPDGHRGTMNLVQSVPRLAEETGAIFWRGECGGQVSGVRCQVSNPRVLRRAIEPEWTWRTSLEGTNDELLARMHEKHRYNVRLAERRGVVVRAVPPPHAPPPVEGGKEKSFLPIHRSGGGAGGGGDLDAFWSLLRATARRQEIATHPHRYYETMLRVLVRPPTSDLRSGDTDCRLYIAEHGGVPIAVGIIAYYSDCATYLHGGSSHAHRALMAPHLLHWQAMRDAKVAGMRWYDFGGIEPPKTETLSNEKTEQPESAVAQLLSPSVSQSAHAWAGMTRFKQGFGGEAVHHLPTRDLVFRSGWYRALSLLARLRN